MGVNPYFLRRRRNGRGYSVGSVPAVIVADFERQVFRPSMNFGDLFTFSRASTATYIDATGTLQTAGANVPRYDYASGARRLLVEGAATNLFTRSEADSLTGLTSGGVSLETGLDWRGGAVTTGYSFTGGVSGYIYEDPAGGVGDYVLSCIAVCGDGEAPNFSSATSSSSINDFCLRLRNLVDPTSYNVEPLEDGRYFVWANLNMTDAGSCGILKYAANVNDSLTVSCVQVEQGSAPTSYIPTSGSTATRAADVISTDLAAGTYDVRVVANGVTTDLLSVAHAGGAYWPSEAAGSVAQVLVYPEGALA